MCVAMAVITAAVASKKPKSEAAGSNGGKGANDAKSGGWPHVAGDILEQAKKTNKYLKDIARALAETTRLLDENNAILAL